jgi:hypothetical protein
MKNLSFCEHLNQEGSLASLGMTAFGSRFRVSESIPILRLSRKLIFRIVLV